MRFRDLVIAFVLFILPTAAQAHPHEWIDVASEFLFDGKGQVTAIRHHWRFDEAFSAFALQGLDADSDGAYSAQELKPLAQENVESLADFEYFTYLSAGDYRAGFAAPKNYSLELDDENRLTLHFTLPLAQPLFTRGEVLLQVYDPEYYIALTLPSAEAVRLVDAPAGCRLSVRPAQGHDARSAAALATVGPEQRDLPTELQELATGIDNSATVNCGGPTVAAAEPQGNGGAPSDAADAISRMAGAAGTTGNLAALEAQPEASPNRAGSGLAAPQRPGGFLARVGALQASFSRDLTESLKALKSDGNAFWWLGGLSFVYGIVHAAGPGHGKVVISSYLVANEQRARRGIGIAFLSALVQALVAVGIVGLMAIALNMTSMAINDAAGLFETGSFALVAALGLYLLVTKARKAWAALRSGDPHAGHSHDRGHAHHPGAAHAHRSAATHRIAWSASDLKPGGAAAHHPGCACAHHASPAALERPGWTGAAAAVVSVGLRPCSGALVVLVFALAQGIFWAGVASTFLMALGTAITVAALAALAVGAKDLARRMSQGDDRRSGQVMAALEVVAALFITVLGVVLFAGSLSA